MKFDYAKFNQEISADYNHDFSQEEINALLDLDEGYDSKDTPVSTGKRLVITRVIFKGIKTNGDVINFSQEIKAGINIWIADNLRGKSSLFKIIKFALTGRNDLKHDVKKWLTHILVGFRINDKHYSVYFDRSSRSLLAKLYGKDFASFLEVENSDLAPIFEVTNEEKYQDNIEDFFFKQFSYYSLKWTQKDSRKEVNELNDARASWATYFKSIFLESKDSDRLMYGDQGKKIFQMLLGLQLTYPINRLSIRKDRFEFEKGKRQSIQRAQIDQDIDKTISFQNRLLQISKELNQYEIVRRERINLPEIYREYDTLINNINIGNSKNLQLQNQKQQKESLLQKAEIEKNSLKIELTRIGKELTKVLKSRNDLEEFLDIGIFFSNLNIKYCPNCNHEVPEHRKKTELIEKECLLCHETLQENAKNINVEVYEERITNLKFAEENYQTEKLDLQNKIEVLDLNRNNLSLEIENIDRQLSALPDLTSFKKRLNELEVVINHEKEKALPDEKRKENLIAQKAVIEFQLQQLTNSTKNENDNILQRKIDLLSDAIERLNQRRYEVGKNILQSLSILMLSEINDLGLNSITDVNISDNFDISYRQDGDYVGFSEIAEGEQLRVKIAFYLSLIQLDIEHNFGRHTRFLIIDSPSKEEGDAKYLKGFTSVLRSIETRFGESLQIFIGTAERELSNSISNPKIIPEGEFVF